MTSESIDLVTLYLSEFNVNYRSKRRIATGAGKGRVKTSTLHEYLCGIARVLRDILEGIECNPFRMPTLMTIVDNYFRKLQREGSISDNHYTLSIDDVKKISTHLNKLKRIPVGYRDRLVFAVGLATGIRPTVLYLLELNQMKVENVRGNRCITFYAKVAGNNGESKRNGAGWKAVKDRSAVFPISNEALLRGTLNL